MFRIEKAMVDFRIRAACNYPDLGGETGYLIDWTRGSGRMEDTVGQGDLASRRDGNMVEVRKNVLSYCKFLGIVAWAMLVGYHKTQGLTVLELRYISDQGFYGMHE
jgi:hypothetical protein